MIALHLNDKEDHKEITYGLSDAYQGNKRFSTHKLRNVSYSKKTVPFFFLCGFMITCSILYINSCVFLQELLFLRMCVCVFKAIA